MALWHRLRFSLHYRHRWQCSRPLLADHPVDGRWRFTDPPILSFLGAAVRSFAAPVQAKPKPKPKPDNSAQKGPRLNGAITAKRVRLVTAEGHGVVPIQVALDHAMKFKLDLVEVQGTVDPPVCKLMDFHKEKYMQEIKEKERAQNKTTLRTGDNKEVRFKAKTELKDLKIKADAITRLMERGYRVKCTAMPTGQGEENLGSLLSRLLALIEDVALVESGPHVSAAHAYVIVRHNKFATKKSGKKAIRSLAEGSKGVQIAVPKATISSNPTDAMSLQTEEELEPIEATSETECKDPSEQDDDQVYNEPITSLKEEDDDRRMGLSGVKSTEDANSRKSLHNQFSSSKSVFDVLKPKRDETKEQTDVKYSTGFVPFPSEPAVAENNRYSKQDTKDRFHQIRSTGRVPQHAVRTGSERQGQFDPRQKQFDPASPSFPSPQFNPASPSSSSPQFHCANPSSPSPQFNCANPSSPSPSYGIRSTGNVPEHAIRNGSERQHQFDPRQKQFNPANASSPSPQFNPASPSSPSPQFNRANPSSPSPSYGIRSTESVPQHAIRNGSERQRQFDPRQKQFNPANPSSPSPSYGIFSAQERAGYQGSGTFTATKTAPSSDHNHSGDAAFSKSTSPKSSPSYGIFSTPKTVLSDKQEKLGGVGLGKPSNPNCQRTH